MNTRYVWLLFVSFVSGSFGFIGEMLDTMEDIPLRFVSGTCFLLLHQTYDPGEFEMRIRLNKPTIDLYSSNFFSFDRQYHGMTYRIINLIPLKSGLASIRFTVGYFGSRYHSPRSWCERITPVPTLSPTEPTTSSTTTVSVTTTTDRATTTTTDRAMTTTFSTPSPTTSTVSQPTTSTTTLPMPTTPTEQDTTSTTQSTTTQPTITTTTSGTSTLGTAPPRPTPA